MTNLGRCITVAAMLMGVIVIALPITVVGTTFTTTYSEMKGAAECNSGHSVPEAALLMSAIGEDSSCHAQQGCHGLMRPTRMRDRISIGTSDTVPADLRTRVHSGSRPLDAIDSAHGTVTPPEHMAVRRTLDASQDGRMTTWGAQLVADLCAEKV